MSPYGERIASVEVEVKELKASLVEFKADTKEEFGKINEKLNILVKSHDKGAGIIQLLGWIVGPSFITAIIYALPYLMRH